MPKLAARWLRLFLLLGGDIEVNPGPKPLIPRGPLDLESGFAASTRYKMAKSLERFRAWILAEFGAFLEQILVSADRASTALRAYGLHLYAAGLPRYLLVYAITSIQDLCPGFRNHLTSAWQIDKKWQAVEPGECRPVISVPILEAAVTIGAETAWHIHVQNPKTARFARRQHTRLDDEVTLRYLEARYQSLPSSAGYGPTRSAKSASLAGSHPRCAPRQRSHVPVLGNPRRPARGVAWTLEQTQNS